MSLKKPSSDIPGATQLDSPTANIPVGMEEEEKTAEDYANSDQVVTPQDV
jgi:hypothetical protein